MSQNIWDTLSSKVRGGPMALSLFVIALAALVIGIVLSVEDWKSSYDGLIYLEQAFSIRTVSWSWVQLVMAITPWVGQIVFLGLWSLDTSRRWALAVAVMWFVLDFVADVQLRSNAVLFPLDGGSMNLNRTVAVSSILTFLFFTVGAELFVTAGSAIVVTLFPDAVKEFARLRASVKVAFRDAERILKQSEQRGGGSGGGQSHGLPTGQPRRSIGSLASLLDEIDE